VIFTVQPLLPRHLFFSQDFRSRLSIPRVVLPVDTPSLLLLLRSSFCLGSLSLSSLSDSPLPLSMYDGAHPNPGWLKKKRATVFLFRNRRSLLSCSSHWPFPLSLHYIRVLQTASALLLVHRQRSVAWQSKVPGYLLWNEPRQFLLCVTPKVGGWVGRSRKRGPAKEQRMWRGRRPHYTVLIPAHNTTFPWIAFLHSSHLLTTPYCAAGCLF
jgi:hypothetical protein